VSRLHPVRVATVRVAVEKDGRSGEEGWPTLGRRLIVALLAGSPRVADAGPGMARVDARGWDRRGGEPALGRTLRRAAAEAGFTGIGVGIADVPVASDAAAYLAAAGESDGAPDTGGRDVRIVAPGGAREFLALLPLSALPLPEEMAETFRALGLRRVADIADRPPEEFEARFGPAGVRAHRLARGIDDRAFRALEFPDVPQASLELSAPVDTLEPLLFVLRHLLARVCADLADAGRCAARLELELRSERGIETATAVPARPTRQERLLYDLCRAALERAAGAAGRLGEPVEELALRAVRVSAPDARQEDLFTRRWRDPLAAAAALSRLQVRLGERAIVHPDVRADHRPESRSVWTPVEIGAGGCAPSAQAVADASLSPADPPGAIPGVLHLLPEPLPLRVSTEADRPTEMWGESGHHTVAAAEGPERLSGDWWKDPYHREYFRVCTEEGGLLWLFREYRPSGELRWWLHGWWD
jgi:protein ImuB